MRILRLLRQRGVVSPVDFGAKEDFWGLLKNDISVLLKVLTYRTHPPRQREINLMEKMAAAVNVNYSLLRKW